MPKAEYMFKLVVVGDSGIGKSQLLSRFTNDEFDLDSKSTIGVEFSTRQIEHDGKTIEAQVWDTAGQERYHSLAPMYYRGAAAAILVYDMTKKSSFEKLQKWVDELKERGPDGIVLCVAANK